MSDLRFTTETRCEHGNVGPCLVGGWVAQGRSEQTLTCPGGSRRVLTEDEVIEALQSYGPLYAHVEGETAHKFVTIDPEVLLRALTAWEPKA